MHNGQTFPHKQADVNKRTPQIQITALPDFAYTSKTKIINDKLIIENNSQVFRSIFWCYSLKSLQSAGTTQWHCTQTFFSRKYVICFLDFVYKYYPCNIFPFIVCKITLCIQLPVILMKKAFAAGLRAGPRVCGWMAALSWTSRPCIQLYLCNLYYTLPVVSPPFSRAVPAVRMKAGLIVGAHCIVLTV